MANHVTELTKGQKTMRIKKTLLMTAMMAAGALGALHGASACRLELAVSKSAAAVPSAQKTHE